MNRSIWQRIVVAASLSCATPVVAEGLTPESLQQWAFVSDAQASADGVNIAYVVQTARSDGKGYDGDIWLGRSGNTERWIGGDADDRSPRWSPDGRRLAFLSNRSGKRQVFIREADGAIWQATVGAVDVTAFAWSPDGVRVAFIAMDSVPPDRPDVVMVSDRLVYRVNGSPGFKGEGYSQIWLADIGASRKASPPRQVTRAPYDHGGIEWTAEGHGLYFTANRAPADDYEAANPNIYRISLAAPEEVIAVTDAAGNEQSPKASPDGRWLAFFSADAGTPRRAYTASRLALRDLRSGLVTELADSDGAGEIATTDSTPIATQATRLAWSRNGRYAYFTRARSGRVEIMRVDTRTMRVAPASACVDGIVRDISIGDRGLVATIASPLAPADVFSIGAGCTVKQVSGQGAQNVAGIALGIVSEHRIGVPDGRSIQYWKIVPPQFDRRRAYPAILYIHGGPHDMYGRDFFHEFQLLAAKGYVVLLGNPRGSSGYGTEFGNSIQGAFPGEDANDLLTIVDDAIQAGGIDARRLGVAGGSGGGVLSSWIIGQTTRFSAAIVERSITDWGSFVGTSDLAAGFVRAHFPDFVWRAREAYWRKSSLSLVDKVQTPVLVIHNEQDYRTPLEQGLEYYTALKLLKKPAKLAVFPASSHSMYREGTPEQRVARLHLIVDWFDTHLAAQGASIPDPGR